MKANLAKLKKEMEAGIKEPDVGLSLRLHPESFRGLVKEQGDVEIQALLLLNLGKVLSGGRQSSARAKLAFGALKDLGRCCQPH